MTKHLHLPSVDLELYLLNYQQHYVNTKYTLLCKYMNRNNTIDIVGYSDAYFI